MFTSVDTFNWITSVPVLVACKSEFAISGTSSIIGAMKKAPPTAPTVTPTRTTNRIFFLLPVFGKDVQHLN